MNTGQISRPLSGFTLFFSLSLLVPLALALFEETELATAAFAEAMAIGLFVAFLLWFGGRKSSSDFFRKEGILAPFVLLTPGFWRR